MILLALRRLCDRPQHPDREVLGQCERAALAAALRLRGELDTRITALAVGPAVREDRVLAMALRAGCDDAIRVHDPALDDPDYLVVARAIAAVARRVSADLVLCGDRSEDERQGATGAAVAELLAAPHLAQVVDLQARDGRLRAVQRTGGQLHTWHCSLPAVMCLAAFPRARHAGGDGERDREARGGGGITELDLPALGVDRTEVGERSRLIGPARPTRASSRAIMLASPGELVERLARERLIG